MRIQQDVFSEALGIITGTCLEVTNFAHRILDRWEGWESVERFDHRTLQMAHDKIAAAWRFQCLPSLRQMELTHVQESKDKPDFAKHWLDWLREEIQSWKHNPYLIRLVVEILKNQNQPVGYRAEANLNWELIDRYLDVPWEQWIRDATSADLHYDYSNPA